MGRISDSRKLCQVLIPGTHNSGAYGILFGLGQTQDWSIKEQLENGVRFLDIRLARNLSPNDFEVVHGFIKLGSFKKFILSPVTKFLTDNPSEVILMRIKTYGFDFGAEARLERDFMMNLEYRFYQKIVNSNTSISQVRGKIVLLKKHHKAFKKKIGLEWPLNNNVQDKYQIEVKSYDLQMLGTTYRISCPFIFGIDIKKKSDAILKHFNQSARHYGSGFYINFASGSYYGLFIWRIASVTNKVVLDYFKTNSHRNIGSIVVIDYPNRIPGLVETLIEYNFYSNFNANDKI
eukprot:TCONS_00063278-protein